MWSCSNVFKIILVITNIKYDLGQVSGQKMAETAEICKFAKITCKILFNRSYFFNKKLALTDDQNYHQGPSDCNASGQGTQMNEELNKYIVLKRVQSCRKIETYLLIK